jgi:hypothetical protein
MKAVFPGINPDDTYEMIVAVNESKVNFWIHDATDEEVSVSLDISFDEATELIKFLQDKMLKI